MIKKIVMGIVVFGFMFSTITAYAWWDHQQTKLDQFELELGYGQRITLTNVTTSNQGLLIPDFDGVPRTNTTTQFEVKYLLNFSRELTDFDFEIRLENLSIRKDNIVERYDASSLKHLPLEIKIASFDESIDFFPSNPYPIQHAFTFFQLNHSLLSLPSVRFEILFSLNYENLTQLSSSFLQASLISFDLSVEVVV
jgi:hypothetical protein